MASGRLHLIGLQLRQGTYELDRHWQRRWPLPGLAHAWEAGKAARQGCPPAELRRLRSLNTVISLRVNASAAFPKVSFVAWVVFVTPNERKRSCRASDRQHFALERHLLRASLYRKQLASRFAD